MKRCKICNELFEPTCNSQKFCGKLHYTKCPVCNHDMIWNSMRKVKPCSTKCSNELRMQTVLAKYGVKNVSQLGSRNGSKDSRYDNLAYMHNIDKQIAKKWASYGIDVYRNNDVDELLFSNCINANSCQVYICTGKFNESECVNFFRENGTDPEFTIHSNGITLNLGNNDDGVIYQSMRIELTKIKNFDCAITNVCTLNGYRVIDGIKTMIQTLIDIYEIRSIIAVLHPCPEAAELYSAGFEYQFDLSGKVKWSDGKYYKRTDNISEKLSQGLYPTVYPVRKVYMLKNKTAEPRA